VTEARRVHALRVRYVTPDQRQAQRRLGVTLRPVAQQLRVGDDAVALSPAQQALVIQHARELHAPQARHAATAAALPRRLLRVPRPTTPTTNADSAPATRYTKHSSNLGARRHPGVTRRNQQQAAVSLHAAS